MSSKNKPNPIAFVITSMPVGGAETLLVNLVDRIDKQQYAPEIVCLKSRGPLGEELANRIPVHHDLIGGKYDVGVLPRLVRLFRSRKYSAVITVGAGDKMFWGRLAAWMARVPKIASALHSTGWPDGVGRMNRWLTSITDHFIAVAKSHGEFLQDFEGFPSNKVVVVPNGIDTDRFCVDSQAAVGLRLELGVPSESSLVGIVAALRPEKDHRLFVEVASKVIDRHREKRTPLPHFVIVGDGPEREGIESRISELGLNAQFHLLGTRHDTPSILAGLNLFALTSKNEASPVSILEAMACGVPVVAPDVGSIRESVLDGETGYVVPPGDADSMMERWVGLLENPKKRLEMGGAARRHVESYGSLNAMVSGYETMLASPTTRSQHRSRATQHQMVRPLHSAKPNRV
ncbi:MAG: glycosyltransferase [Planctomycetota bacterium]